MIDFSDEIDVDIQPVPIWKAFYKGNWDKAILIGGRSFGKTYVASDFTVQRIVENPYYKAQVFRDTDKSLKNSVLTAIKKRFFVIADQYKQNGWDLLRFFDVQETQIKFTEPETKETVYNLTKKGFKKYDNSKEATNKGDEEIALQIFEEMQDLTDEEAVQVAQNTAKVEGKKTIYILNTPYLDHWIVKRYFDYEFVEKVGETKFFRLIPKKSKDRILAIFGTYKDNPFVAKSVVKEYESYNDPESLEYNKEYYYKHILGYATEKQTLPRKFSFELIQKLRDRAKPIKTTKEFTVCPNTSSAKIAKVKFYHNLLTNQYYVLSIDFSSGVGQDYTTIQLRTQDSQGIFRQVATVKDKLTINQTSDLALQLANFINSFGNQTILAPEINTPYDVPITYWKEHGYNMDLVYQEIDPDTKQIQDTNLTQYGFRTTAQNRNAIIDKYKLLLDKDLIEVNDLEELKEMEVFVLNDKGKFEALPSHHDDLLLADFINIQGFEFLRRSV